jgi:CubicO group peptidase (beta-lactamase class C family)
MKVAKPESLGFDAARLARIPGFVKARYLDSGKLPHAQLLIARDGQIVHFSSQGAAREGGAEIDENSLFRIASMTKPVTSLHDAGRGMPGQPRYASPSHSPRAEGHRRL